MGSAGAEIAAAVAAAMVGHTRQPWWHAAADGIVAAMVDGIAAAMVARGCATASMWTRLRPRSGAIAAAVAAAQLRPAEGAAMMRGEERIEQQLASPQEKMRSGEKKR